MNIDESRNAKGFTPGSQVPNRTIEEIFIHHWGERGQTHDGVVNFFCNGPGATSAHFVASDGRVNCIVSMADVAWHAGVWDRNIRSVGIECRPEATDGDYREVSALVAWIRNQVGKDLPLVPHRAVHATACPGVWDLARIDREARALAAPAPVVPAATPKPVAPKPAPPKPKPAPAPTVIRWVPDPHWVVERGETLGQIAAYYGVSVDRIAKYNGIKNVNVLRVGEWIWPPVGRDTWTVDPGDTLSKIAKFYGITVDRLCNPNGINNPNELTVGRRLQIPK